MPGAIPTALANRSCLLPSCLTVRPRVWRQGNLFWDGDAGRCVEESACSRTFELPPGLALGRPFLPANYDPSKPLPNTKVVPLVASPAEGVSDWLGEF